MPVCDFNPASEEYADFIIRHNNSSPEDILLQQKAGCIDYVDQEFAVVYSQLEPLLPITTKTYTYFAIPTLYTLLDTTSMESSGIIQTAQQPSLNLRGEGTMIGFIDTGIDYRNPLFRLPDGSSRIAGIWDQTLPEPTGTMDASFGIPASTPAMSFSYGQEFLKPQIDEALRSSDPLSVVPSMDTSGHGTFMAGIAAGGATPNEDFTGAAPNCSIGVVKLKPAKQYLRDFY
ncbi:MAG: S8 family serine peptidase, partial [Hungatella hathewayi]|nr:S8 family serine peptidase [Hungatella hathewayi]